jgi:hypothetical protein
MAMMSMDADLRVAPPEGFSVYLLRSVSKTLAGLGVRKTSTADVVELSEGKAREESNPGIELEVRALEGAKLDVLRPDNRAWVRVVAPNESQRGPKRRH